MSIIIWVRSFLSTLIFLIYFFTSSLMCVLLTFITDNQKFFDWFLNIWGQIVCFIFNVKVKIEGLENISNVKGAVFLFNHTSFFDIFATMGHIPGLRFGAKIELFKIPFFGSAMRRTGVIPINRSQKEAVFKVYDDSLARLRSGARIGLSPEGGRMLQEKLYPFKAGPFIFAIKAQVPVVPVVITGAREVMGKKDYIPHLKAWSSEIRVRVLKPISTEGYTVQTRSDLQRIVFYEMSQYLEPWKKQN